MILIPKYLNSVFDIQNAKSVSEIQAALSLKGETFHELFMKLSLYPENLPKSTNILL